MAIHASMPHPHGRSFRTHTIIRGVCVTVLLTSGIWAQLPSAIWASVYQCVDHAGRQILTNRTAGLRNCHVLLESATGESKPGAGKKPKASNQPTDDGTSPPYIDTPPPATVFPNDPPMPWMNTSPGDTSSAQPCAPGFNPLNPMSTAPCAQADDPHASGPGQYR